MLEFYSIASRIPPGQCMGPLESEPFEAGYPHPGAGYPCGLVAPGWHQDAPRMAPRAPKGGKRRRIQIGSDSDPNRIRLETDRGPTMARQGMPEVKMTPKMYPKMDPKTIPKVIPKLVDFRIPIGKPFWCSWRSHGSQGWPQVGASRPAESV